MVMQWNITDKDTCKNDARTKSFNFNCHSSLSFVIIMCKNKEKKKKHSKLLLTLFIFMVTKEELCHVSFRNFWYDFVV